MIINLISTIHWD